MSIAKSNRSTIQAPKEPIEFYANLSSADCKYIKIDETTIFDECLYENMMIDLPTAELLPVFMDRAIMQIIEEYRLVTRFLFKKEFANIGRSIIDDFSDIVQTKFEKVKVSQQRKSINEIEFNIDAATNDNKEKIEQELFNFSRVLRGEIGLESLTDDPFLLERVGFNNKMREFQLQFQQKQLIANNELSQKMTTMTEIVNELANQLKNNLLPAGPNTNARADFIVTLHDGQRKAIEVDEIVYIEKEVSDTHPHIYKTNGEMINVDELMSDLSSRLLVVRPTIIMIHRSYIVNLSFVTRKENDGNNYKIYTGIYPDSPLPVGQNHKKRFNEAIIQYGIVLDAEVREVD